MVLLVITFVASLGGLLLFVWSMSKGLFGSADAASRVIFGASEVGLIEEPAARTAEAQDDLQETMNRTGHTGEFSILSLEEADERARQDESGRWPVLLSIGFAVLWLVLASAFGLIASIKLHVLVIGGFAIYFVGLSIGGWLQGLAMLDAARPFIDSVNITKPYLLVRTMGGTLMTLGHLVFATHVAMMLMRRGSQRTGATLLRRYAGTPVSGTPVRRYAGIRYAGIQPGDRGRCRMKRDQELDVTRLIVGALAIGQRTRCAMTGAARLSISSTRDASRCAVHLVACTRRSSRRSARADWNRRCV